MTGLLYLQDSSIVSTACTLLELNLSPEGQAAILDVTPFYVKGGGQPSDTGRLVGLTGEMAIVQVVRTPDGKVIHLGQTMTGQLAPGDQVVAVIDIDVRLRHSRLHTAGEVICAAVHQLGQSWPITTASHIPGQSRVAFATDLPMAHVAEFAELVKQCFEKMVAFDTPVLVRPGVSVEEAKRLCPLDADVLLQKAGPIRLVSPIPGFCRPCMGAHLTSTGQIGAIAFRKFRLRRGELSISYDLA